MNNTAETIQKYIDMEIVSFIDNLTNSKSFSEINGMIQLMDVEHSRLTQNREVLAKAFAEVKTNSKEFETIFTQYVGSFVLEQKLIDRRAIADHIKGIKGASNVLRPKTDLKGSEGLSEASGEESTVAPRSSSKISSKDIEAPRTSSKTRARKGVSIEPKGIDLEADTSELAKEIVNTSKKH